MPDTKTQTTPEDIEKLARRICATLQIEGDWPWEYVMTEIRDWLGTGGERRWPEKCDWPQDRDFTFFDEPGEHDPCYLIDPSGQMHAFNGHAGEGVDIARARFIMRRLNAKI
jgi:hypothetical protein